jgi:hypothetical protein
LDFFPIWKNFHNAGRLKHQSILSSGVEISADVFGHEVATAHTLLQRQGASLSYACQGALPSDAGGRMIESINVTIKKIQ